MTLSLTVQQVPLNDLEHYPGNARRGDADEVAKSLRANGMFRPLVVQRSTSYVLAGNHTLDAVHQLYAEDLEQGNAESPWATVPVTFIDVPDDHARRIVLVDNRTSDLAGYDEQALYRLLQEVGEDLTGTGFEDEDMAALASVWANVGADPDDPEDQTPSAGDLLALADVSIAEPSHQVHHGSVYQVGRHVLVVARVSTEHRLWVPYLRADDVVFCPYPEPYLTTTELAASSTLLLVQPNRYLAGHLLDKHASIYPGTIEQIA